MDHRAFSEDGYLIDQKYTADCLYGKWSSDYNGCGWIAVYNLFKACGRETAPEEVLEGMNAILTYKGSRGTPVAVMEQYLKSCGFRYIRADGIKKILPALLPVRAGVFRYTEGRIPHYVAFLRTDEKHFRFFNIGTGCEDRIFTMEEFFADHVKMPIIKAMLAV